MNRIDGNDYSNRIRSNEQVRQQALPKTDRQFQSFVDEALKHNDKQQNTILDSNIQVSNHAKKRMEQRGIQLDGTDMSNLEQAFTTLEDKGAENSLILYEDLSLIASVTNRTIITASRTNEMKIITNIDSAIQIEK